MEDGWGGCGKGGGVSLALSSLAGDFPDTIQCAYIHLVSREECERAYPGQITQNMVCAGDEKHGKDSCQVRQPGPASYTARDRDANTQPETGRERHSSNESFTATDRDKLGENQRQENGERLSQYTETPSGICRDKKTQTAETGTAETKMEMERSRIREMQ